MDVVVDVVVICLFECVDIDVVFVVWCDVFLYYDEVGVLLYCDLL